MPSPKTLQKILFIFFVSLVSKGIKKVLIKEKVEIFPFKAE